MKPLSIKQLENYNTGKEFTPGPFRQNGTEVESEAPSHHRFVVCEHSALTNQDVETWRKLNQGLGNPESNLPNFFEELERITALLNNLPNLIAQLKDAREVAKTCDTELCGYNLDLCPACQYRETYCKGEQ